MARVEAEALEPHESERIFVAARLEEAQQVEDVLTQAGVDYHVKVDKRRRGDWGASPI
jgi:hypothetical protein